MKHTESGGEHLVQERFGTVARAAAFYKSQVLPYLNKRMIQFIREQDMIFISTADGKGQCDCSFRSGSPGFVQVLDCATLAYPEYRGNGVMASLGNLVENPHIGLIFLDFCRSTIGLHVNGAARVLSNDEAQHHRSATAEMRAAIGTTGGRHPECWVLIEVQEAYIHCSKHVPLLKKAEKHIEWGTDDECLKGGDFFQAKTSPRVLNEPSVKS